MVDLTTPPPGEHGIEQDWRSSQARRAEEIFEVVEVRRFDQLPGSDLGAVNKKEDVIMVLDKNRGWVVHAERRETRSLLTETTIPNQANNHVSF